MNTYDKLMTLRELPDAYANWKEYRRLVSRYITDNTMAQSSALIVGAGRCNDLDLLSLSSHFSHITLMDCNLKAMEQGVEKQQTSYHKLDNIELVQQDILGIPEYVYRDLCDEMETLIRDMAAGLRFGRSADQLFEEAMTEAYKHVNVTLGNVSADYVICCGVHSQLNNIFPQLAELYSNHTMLDLEAVYRRTSKMNSIIASDLNDELLSGVNVMSLFNISASEQDLQCDEDAGANIADSSSEGGTSDDDLSAICDNIPAAGLILACESSRHGIFGGVECAAQALADIQHRIIEGKAAIVAPIHLSWPFDESQGKLYDMAVMIVTPEL